MSCHVQGKDVVVLAYDLAYCDTTSSTCVTNDLRDSD
jgi:hypothetical protein